MRKVIFGSVTLLSLIILVACSSNNSDKSTTEQTTNQTTETTLTTEATTTIPSSVDNSQYDAVVHEIKTLIDSETSVEIENNIVDADYPDGHNVIRVVIIGENVQPMKETFEAVNSNTATTEQHNIIAMAQMLISDLGKLLPDETTTIELGYEISAEQYQLIAKSSKIKDFIPVGELILE